tara:strand:- start:789 stop:1274 length:486 start_codon:yes stop_codon:yes gene_type:complete
MGKYKKKKSPFKYIGVDPGKSGGLTVINEDGTIKAFKCPEKVLDMSLLFQVAISDTAPCDVKFLMERVWARPTNGSRHAFTYGVNYGQWLGIAASHDIHTYTEIPNNWIKWFGCPKGVEVRKRKNWLKDKAKELYPKLKKVTLATADSILITHYAKHKYFV